MANYGLKEYKKYRQILCGVEGKKLPQCERDIKEIIAAWEDNPSIYESDISEYQKGIINFWGTSSDLCDDDQGLEQLRSAADAGDVNAMNLCAMAYYLISKQGKYALGEEGCQQYLSNAIKYWKLGAENGQAEAISNLAICYLEAIGVDRDLQKAKELFKKAVKAKHPAAKDYLKQSKLDKWKPGDDYADTSLTTREAVRNAVARPKKKTTKEKITETVSHASIKAKRISMKDAFTLFQNQHPDLRVIECFDYEFYIVFGTFNKEMTLNMCLDEYPVHFKLNKLTKVVSLCSVMEMLNSAQEGKTISVHRYLSKEDALFLKDYSSK